MFSKQACCRSWVVVPLFVFLLVASPTGRWATQAGLVAAARAQGTGNLSLGGYIFEDTAVESGKLTSTDWTINGASLTLTAYSDKAETHQVGSPTTVTTGYNPLTKMGGYYDFGGLSGGDYYSLALTSPALSASPITQFVSVVGGQLTIQPQGLVATTNTQALDSMATAPGAPSGINFGNVTKTAPTYRVDDIILPASGTPYSVTNFDLGVYGVLRTPPTGWNPSTCPHIYYLAGAATPVPPDFSLPAAVTDVRELQNSKGTPVTVPVTVVNPLTATAVGTFMLTPTSGLKLTSTTGATTNTPVSFNLGWASTAQSGARSATVSLNNLNDPGNGGLGNNETLTVTGAVVQPRKLGVVASSVKNLNNLNLLLGAPAADLLVTTSNAKPSDNNTTRVWVAQSGAKIGPLLVQPQEITGAGINVPVPLTGAALDSYGTIKGSGTLGVTTAEAASVHDTTKYAGLPVSYNINVGVASLGKTADSFSGAMVLSANMPAGSSMTGLASEVNPKGTLAANTTPAASVTAPSSFGSTAKQQAVLYGPVGSQAEIVSSDPLPAATTVTMQWRARTPSEAAAPGTTSPTLPSGVQWLTSDVVQIMGVPKGVDYALQMTFDNRINLALDGPISGTVANETESLYLAEWNGSGWVNANTLGGHGADAQFEVRSSLADFMAAHKGDSLDSLLGSWGVDPNTNGTGIGDSWAIVAGGGSGMFVVVPEPSTCLLAAAGLALLALARRRRPALEPGVPGRSGQ
ncbi:MAG: PEP-CTERM sorting domain-containing protein [Thermoguttaceae bacterium]|jgi:hypothetical protein